MNVRGEEGRMSENALCLGLIVDDNMLSVLHIHIDLSETSNNFSPTLCPRQTLLLVTGNH